MRKDSDPHQWIHNLNIGQARRHLADRGLSVQGILPVLRARLRYERNVNGESEEDEDAMSLEEKGDASARDLLGEGAATDPKSPLLLGGPEIKVDEVAGRATDDRPTQCAQTATQPTTSRPGRASTT